MAKIEYIYADCGNVTVDASVNRVQVANNPNNCFFNGTGNSGFDQQDNLVIEAAGWTLPYCLRPAEQYAIAQFEWFGPNGAYSLGDVFSIGDYLVLPSEDEILPINLYLPYPVYADGDTQKCIRLIDFSCDVNMINVSADLDQEDVPIQMWLRVKHNLDILP